MILLMQPVYACADQVFSHFGKHKGKSWHFVIVTTVFFFLLEFSKLGYIIGDCMITKIRDYIRKKKKDFSLIQYTKRFVTSITIFTMLVILLCIWRGHGKAYSLASTAMTMLWKIGGSDNEL